MGKKRQEIKALVVGYGSIGKRRKVILDKLDGVSAEYCDTDFEYRSRLTSRHNAVIICSPPDTHIPYAIMALEDGCNVFVEKPLSHSMAGLESLLRIVRRRREGRVKRRLMVACNMRYNKAVQKFWRRLHNKRASGKPLAVGLSFGYDLRKWRVSDYRANYAMSTQMGGGITLDSIHELDELFHFAGPPVEARALSQRGGIPDLSSDTRYDAFYRMHDGLCAYVHLNYLTDTYTRTRTGITTVKRLFSNVSPEDAMYEQEMREFVNLCRDPEYPNPHPIEPAIRTLAWALLTRNQGYATAHQVEQLFPSLHDDIQLAKR